MLDKIKAFWGNVKDVVVYIVAPLSFLAGYIWYLLTQNHKLEDELQAKDGDEKIKELQGEQKEIDSGAGDAVAQFEKLRAGLLARSPSSGEGYSGSTNTDPNKGPGTQPGPSSPTS